MTSFTPLRAGRDFNVFMTNPSYSMTHYAEVGNGSYNYSSSPPCDVDPRGCAFDTTSFTVARGQTLRPLPSEHSVMTQYSYGSPVFSTSTLEHRRTGQDNQYFGQHISMLPHLGNPYHPNSNGCFVPMDVESQESANEDTMLSEPVSPPLTGFPSIQEFDQLIKW